MDNTYSTLYLHTFRGNFDVPEIKSHEVIQDFFHISGTMSGTKTAGPGLLGLSLDDANKILQTDETQDTNMAPLSGFFWAA